MERLLIMLHLLMVCIMVAGAAAITRDDFPDGFIFGAGTSAYQVEGAAAEDGRKPSIWDTFTHAGKTTDHTTGDIAADQYHKYKEDVKLIHETGLDAYRFSISWSRLIPDGRGAVNPKGLQYYNNLIDELISYGIAPHVTLYHFDLPQKLQDEYTGLLDLKIVQDFTNFANICFKEFGDRVKHWITFNEPNLDTLLGYDDGTYPPNRCSYPFGANCSEGNSTTEPYIVVHNILLAHASAASLYKQKYQEEQEGYIGITMDGLWYKPLTVSPEDQAAAQRAIDFHIGWILGPLVHGTYPAIMKKRVGSRLPSFSVEEAKILKASFDFIGFNHYSSVHAQADSNSYAINERDYYRDMAIKYPYTSTTLGLNRKDLVQKMPPFSKTPGQRKIREPMKVAAVSPLTPTAKNAWALQELLEYVKLKYGNPPVMIYENGFGEYSDFSMTQSNYADDDRTNYLHEYLKSLLLSVRNGSNARGYFVWSFMDCFELGFGYTARYGLYGVDFYGKDKARYARHSARWYSSFLRGNGKTTKISSV